MTDAPFILYDLAGVGGHARLTHKPSDDTLVAQPWMNQEVFDRLCHEFFVKHPGLDIRTERGDHAGTTDERRRDLEGMWPDLREPISEVEIERLRHGNPAATARWLWEEEDGRFYTRYWPEGGNVAVYRTREAAARHARHRNREYEAIMAGPSRV